jgi:ATP-binding cassette subfamily B (MDR/TAP) protein 1
MSKNRLKSIHSRSQGVHERATWRSLFAFTTANHTLPLISAIFFAIVSSLLKPASAIVFGRLFAVFTRYGAGELDTQQTAEQVAKWCIVMTAIGGATWLTEGLYLSQWIMFGELQARCARGRLFAGLLGKSLQWYDLQDEDVGALSTRIET